jgi:hypothetical protein
MTRCEGEVSEGLRAHFAAEERVGRLRHRERTREVRMYSSMYVGRLQTAHQS